MSKTKNLNEDWLFEIAPKNNFFTLNLKEIWQYRDLLLLFVRRDVVTVYKQTILGPLWYLIQPLLTSVIFTIIFNKFADIQTDGIPPFLFNLTGIIVWNYFATCLTETSDTFKKNANIFGKVYFPRVISPLAVVVSNLLKFGIQFIIFIAFFIYYVIDGQIQFALNPYVLLFPFLVIIMGIIGLGLGMIVSSLVTKYRDLSFLVGFGVQLLMYVSAVMYPMSLMMEKAGDYQWLIQLNPLMHIIETSRYLLLNQGTVTPFGIIYTLIITLVLFFFGLLIFNKTEKSFIDTV
jgi:lipopolysaccharide transport system permease protein